MGVDEYQVDENQGSVFVGMVQSLGVYLMALVALAGVYQSRTPGQHEPQVVAIVILVAAFLSSIAIGAWQVRRKRSRTATGAFLGALVWPCLVGTALALLLSYALSHARIPF